MGDKIILENIELLYGYLYKFDIFNKTKNEHNRFFVSVSELEALLKNGGYTYKK